MIKEPWKYRSRLATEVAKELKMEIDDFLDELNDAGYYCCPKCGEIVNVEELGNDLDKPCDKCRMKKFEVYELTSGGAVCEPFEAEDRESALEIILEENGEGLREVTDE